MYIISLHMHNTDDHGQMPQTLFQDSQIKNTMLPKKMLPKLLWRKNKAVVIVWCVAVCLTVNRSSMLTGSLYKPLYLASRAWISSTLVSLHPKLCLACLPPLSLSFSETSQRPNLASVIQEWSAGSRLLEKAFYFLLLQRCKLDTFLLLKGNLTVCTFHC